MRKTDDQILLNLKTFESVQLIGRRAVLLFSNIFVAKYFIQFLAALQHESFWKICVLF
jgi:lipid-A-disaccharide synthase-like uncharacterized protein